MTVTEVDVFLACEVATLKAISVAAHRCKKSRPRSVRGPEYQYRAVGDGALHMVLSPTITATELEECGALRGVWEQLRAALASHGVQDRLLDNIITACNEYTSDRLTSPGLHNRDMLAQFLGEAHAAART